MFERDAEHEDLSQTRREWRELGLHPGRQDVLGLRDPFGHLLPSKIDVGAILEDRGALAGPVTRERAGHLHAVNTGKRSSNCKVELLLHVTRTACQYEAV